MASWEKIESGHYEHYKRRPLEPRAEYQRREYTRHYEGPCPPDPSKDYMQRYNGLSNTKFGKGFQRRGQSSIHNPITASHAEYEGMATLRRNASLEFRSKLIAEKDSSAGYSLLTGVPKGPGSIVKRSHGLKHFNEDPYAHSRHVAGLTKLLNSGGRYHADPADLSNPSAIKPAAAQSTIQLY